jgi:hypothetical protein
MVIKVEAATSYRCPLEEIAPCCGARCMAWRWVSYELSSGQSLGYCGLAGTPQSIMARHEDRILPPGWMQ